MSTGSIENSASVTRKSVTNQPIISYCNGQNAVCQAPEQKNAAIYAKLLCKPSPAPLDKAGKGEYNHHGYECPATRDEEVDAPMRRILTLLLLLALLGGTAMAESLPLGGPAPYAPVMDALSEDGLSYDDGTMSVRIEKDFVHDTNVYYVYVTITDPSQLRTAVAGQPKGKTTRKASQMAEENNAVLAFNGDFYSYNQKSVGIIYRSGEQIRFNPQASYDQLYIDSRGDLTLVSWPTDVGRFTDYAREQFEAYAADHELVEAFSFGPALIIDGEVQEFDYRRKISCGYPTPDQRLIFCQLDELSYLFVACECWKQGAGQRGLSVPEMTELCAAKGVKHAYNLDGGNSLSILLCGQRINGYNEVDSSVKEREIKDIIYFATLRGE